MSGGAVPGMLEWMPSSPGAAWMPMVCVTAAPQSPPCATNSVYPSRCISSTQARAMRGGSQPVVAGLAENPWPGSEGITRWNASASLPPCDVGSVSGPMIFSCSMTEPGQPCVTISGSASSCRERTWMKWMSSPSISVRKFGSPFSSASHLRQS